MWFTSIVVETHLVTFLNLDPAWWNKVIIKKSGDCRKPHDLNACKLTGNRLLQASSLNLFDFLHNLVHIPPWEETSKMF